MSKQDTIDGGRAFDWGRTSADYAKYRDIYPAQMYQALVEQGLCVTGQRALDLGTGTGVIPRGLYPYGARFTGVDSSFNQIEQAKKLAAEQRMEIDFQCCAAEEVNFPAGSFDVVTACQCFCYLDHRTLAPKLHALLKPEGAFVILYMAWLPREDEIAGRSEDLILKYNPAWTGCGETRHFIEIPDCYTPYFEMEKQEVFDAAIPFRRETWNGRIKACRGVGASLSEEKAAQFDREHRALLERIAPEEFEILHYVAISVLRKKRGETG